MEDLANLMQQAQAGDMKAHREALTLFTYLYDQVGEYWSVCGPPYESIRVQAMQEFDRCVRMQNECQGDLQQWIEAQVRNGIRVFMADMLQVPREEVGDFRLLKLAEARCREYRLDGTDEEIAEEMENLSDPYRDYTVADVRRLRDYSGW